ncbi:hypothetical protein BDR04DRAFT_1234429 [Suillus decipiens]|nr:hypothetical protein BDR04DRAFT_1234429 [Suillus decipiens]
MTFGALHIKRTKSVTWNWLSPGIVPAIGFSFSPHHLHVALEILHHYIHKVPPQDTPATQELSTTHGYDGPPPVDLLADDPEFVYLPAAECPPGCAGDVIPLVFVYLPPAKAAVDVMPPVLVYPPPAVIIAAGSAADVVPPVLAYLPPAVIIAAGSAADVVHLVLVYLSAAGNDAETEC